MILWRENWGSIVEQAERSLSFVDIPVDPLLGPFLISGTSDLLWLETSRGKVRLAPAPINPNLDMDIVLRVAQRSKASGWGSIFPWSEEGLASAQTWVKLFRQCDVSVLVADVDFDEVCGWGMVCTKWPALRAGTAVVVPQDRQEVGIAATVGTGYEMVLVHDPSRALAFASRIL